MPIYDPPEGMPSAPEPPQKTGLMWVDALLGALHREPQIVDMPGMLAGPARYAIQRASPGLGRYLAKRPETFYAHFEGPMAGKLPAANLGEGFETLGAARMLDADRATALTRQHRVLEGLPIPTIQNTRTPGSTRWEHTSLMRGAARPPFQKLPRDLQAGDVEIILNEAFDPNRFRGRYSPEAGGVVPTSKSKPALRAQRETAVHEGMHGSWLAKTRGASGNPPLDKVWTDRVGAWLTQSGDDDLIRMLLQMQQGTYNPAHEFLDAAAKRAATRR